jgi:hypothetical protein
MTSRKSGGALGRGLDALIRSDKESDKDKPEISEVKSETTKKKHPVKKSSKKDKTVEAVIQEVHKNPRISLWSARSAAVLRFLKKTQPEFSISKEASALIEAAVEEKYPEIWEKFKKEDL